MRRIAAAWLVVAACGKGPMAPETIAESPAPIALDGVTPQLAAGERMMWNVFWGGVQIGRADHTLGPRDARTRFRTSMLASVLGAINFELATAHDGSGPRAVTEVLVRDGRTSRTQTAIDRAQYRVGEGPELGAPDGHRLQSLDTALGVIRAWSNGDAPRGYLWFVHRGELFRLDLLRPARAELMGAPVLRVNGIVRSFDRRTALDLSLWLAPNRDRTPLQIAVRAGNEQITAELVEATGDLD